MIYFIGGGARCGKSTLAKALLDKLPKAAYLSGDSFRQSLKPILPIFHTSGVSADSPEGYIQYYTEHTEQAIDETFKRAEALWPFIEKYVTAYHHESDDDLIVESVDIWPQLIRQLALPHKVVFLVDTGAAQWKRVTEHLGENDWITAKNLSPEQIEAWASYNALRGKRITETATSYKYPVRDIAKSDFDSVQAGALLDLLQTNPNLS